MSRDRIRIIVTGACSMSFHPQAGMVPVAQYSDVSLDRICIIVTGACSMSFHPQAGMVPVAQLNKFRSFPIFDMYSN